MSFFYVKKGVEGMIERGVLDALYCECVRDLDKECGLHTKEYADKMKGLKMMCDRIITFLNDSELIFAERDEVVH
tara:strand:+ start:75 stop:299 length:225 start_codon:yes stop_codon:yes gene_type:complete